MRLIMQAVIVDVRCYVETEDYYYSTSQNSPVMKKVYKIIAVHRHCILCYVDDELKLERYCEYRS